MRQYKIIDSDLGYKIFREDEGGEREYYDVQGGWHKNKTYAKIFFHRVDAESALVLIRMKKGKTTSEDAVKGEKQSRSEF